MENNSSLIGLTSIILTGLIIGYFFLITNPPSDLLQYNENLKMATTYHLSGPEIVHHFGSIAIFIITYFLISTFLVSAFMRVFLDRNLINFLLTLTSVILLGFIAFPYYGLQLTVILYSTGAIGVFIGMWIVRTPPRSDYPLLFCVLAPGFIISMWALADFAPTIVWRLGFLVAILIAYLSQYIRFRRRKYKKARKGPST